MRARLCGLVCAALAATAGDAGCRAIDGLGDLSFDGGEDAVDGASEDADDADTDAHDPAEDAGDDGHVHPRRGEDGDAPPP
jgi:hypothetical protein